MEAEKNHEFANKISALSDDKRGGSVTHSFLPSDEMQRLSGSDYLTVDSWDQQTSSINLQTARETPVIHSVDSASRRLRLAPVESYLDDRGLTISADWMRVIFISLLHQCDSSIKCPYPASESCQETTRPSCNWAWCVEDLWVCFFFVFFRRAFERNKKRTCSQFWNQHLLHMKHLNSRGLLNCCAFNPSNLRLDVITEAIFSKMWKARIFCCDHTLQVLVSSMMLTA